VGRSLKAAKAHVKSFFEFFYLNNFMSNYMIFLIIYPLGSRIDIVYYLSKKLFSPLFFKFQSISLFFLEHHQCAILTRVDTNKGVFERVARASPCSPWSPFRCGFIFSPPQPILTGPKRGSPPGSTHTPDGCTDGFHGTHVLVCVLFLHVITPVATNDDNLHFNVYFVQTIGAVH
jgi:hypothetical protein